MVLKSTQFYWHPMLMVYMHVLVLCCISTTTCKYIHVYVLVVQYEKGLGHVMYMYIHELLCLLLCCVALLEWPCTLYMYVVFRGWVLCVYLLGGECTVHKEGSSSSGR